MDALCDLHAMAIWEALRRSSRGLSAAEAAAAIHLPLARVQEWLDRLVGLQLVERRSAGRGRRTATFRVPVPELRVSFADLEPAMLDSLFSRWNESLARNFELLTSHHDGGSARSTLCATGCSALTPPEYAMLKMHLDRIGELMSNAALRRPNSAAASGAALRAPSGKQRICGLLVRLVQLPNDPLPQPNIRFTRDRSPPPDGNTPSRERGGVPAIYQSLSPREWQVAEAMASGLTRPQISRQLGVSLNTVSTLSSRIYRKLQVHSRAELVRLMMQRR